MCIRDRLQQLSIPYHPMVGNHDDRALFRRTLPVSDQTMDNFIQYDIASEARHLLCLDTLKQGSDVGTFCSERTDWLRDKLQSAGNMPVFLFMHHPPMDLGLPMQDMDKMENGQAFLDLLAQFDCVKHLFIGHVHRPITGSVRGIPFSTMRSVLYQAPPPRPDWTWDTFTPAKEAPSIGILHIKDGSVQLQYDQFCDYEFGLTAP